MYEKRKNLNENISRKKNATTKINLKDELSCPLLSSSKEHSDDGRVERDAQKRS